MFHFIYGIILPIDCLIFSRGVGQPPTRLIWLVWKSCIPKSIGLSSCSPARNSLLGVPCSDPSSRFQLWRSTLDPSKPTGFESRVQKPHQLLPFTECSLDYNRLYGKNGLNCHACLNWAQSSTFFMVFFVVFLLLFGGCSKAKHGHRCGERGRSDPSRGLAGDTARHVDLHSGWIQAHRRPGRYTTLHNDLNVHVLYIYIYMCIHFMI